MHFGLSGTVPTTLYIAAIATFLASVFWRPEVGIYFIVPLLPLQTLRAELIRYPLGNKLVDIILLGVILGVLFRKDFKLFVANPLNKLLFVFAVFLYVSLWQGSFFLGGELPLSLDDPRFSNWKNYMIMPLIFLLVVSVLKEVKQLKILVLLMCFATLLADRSLASNVGSRDLSQFSYEMRYGGVFGYSGANGAGAYLAWFVLFLFALYAYQKKPLFKIAIAALAIYSMYSLMLTFSRGAYVAFLVGVIVFGIVKERKILLLLIPFLLVWQFIVPKAVTDRVTMTESRGELDESAALRIALWEDAKTLVAENPVLGSGFDTYEHMHRLNLYVGNIELTDTHNYYLKVLVETGFVGLGLFLLIQMRMCYVGICLHRQATDPFLRSIGLGLACAMVPVVIVNCFGDRWQYLQNVGLLWVVAGCVVRGLMLAQESANKQKASALQETEASATAQPATVLEGSPS